MNRFIRKIRNIGLIVSFIVLLAGCSELEKTAVSSGESSDDVFILKPSYNDDMEEIHEITREQELDDFTIITRYDTIDYDLSDWRIIDNKTIKMSVWAENVPTDWEVIIEHTHVDMFIINKYKKYPIILQDTMDDTYHGVQQDGFLISGGNKYENIFGIIGASPELHEAVNYDDRNLLTSLRERDFYEKNYVANVMQVVYDVMVKKPDEDYFITMPVYDEIYIPVGNIQE